MVAEHSLNQTRIKKGVPHFLYKFTSIKYKITLLMTQA